MIRREQLARAAAALVAGAVIALEHLREREQPEPDAEIRVMPNPVRFPCPMCSGSLADGPHFHDLDVFWPTDDDPMIIITDRQGGDTYIVGGADA